jgi:hypothetical protein
MSIQWKDATSYSQGQRGTINPTAWECSFAGVRIWVSCGHIYYPGEWVMNCDALDLDKRRLGLAFEMPVSEVFAKALALAASEAKKRARDLIEFARAIEAQS